MTYLEHEIKRDTPYSSSSALALAWHSISSAENVPGIASQKEGGSLCDVSSRYHARSLLPSVNSNDVFPAIGFLRR